MVFTDIQMNLVLDGERDRSQLLHTDWLDQRRVYRSPIHLDLEGNKIWMNEYSGSDQGVNRI